MKEEKLSPNQKRVKDRLKTGTMTINDAYDLWRMHGGTFTKVISDLKKMGYLIVSWYEHYIKEDGSSGKYKVYQWRD